MPPMDPAHSGYGPRGADAGLGNLPSGAASAGGATVEAGGASAPQLASGSAARATLAVALAAWVLCIAACAIVDGDLRTAAGHSLVAAAPIGLVAWLWWCHVKTRERRWLWQRQCAEHQRLRAQLWATDPEIAQGMGDAPPFTPASRHWGRALPLALAVATVGVLLAPTLPGSQSAAEHGYRNCAEARRDHHARIPRSDPAYAPHLDGDADGIACEESE